MTITDLFIYPVKSLAGLRVDSARVTRRGLENDRRWMVVRPDGEFVSQRTLPALADIRTDLEGDSIRLVSGAGDIRFPLRRDPGSARTSVTVWNDNVEAVGAAPEASEWLSDAVDEPVRLVWMPDDAGRTPDPAHSEDGDRVSFADGYPLLLTATTSLAELNRHLSRPVPMSRFRPNIVVSTDIPWEEETWRHVSAGRVELEVSTPCARCVVTTVPQLLDDASPTSDQPRPDPTEPLGTLARIHRVNGKAVFGVNLIPRSSGLIRTGDGFSARTTVSGA